MKEQLWTVAMAIVMLWTSTTTTPTLPVLIPTPMLLSVNILDMPEMVFQSMDTAMMLLVPNIHLVTPSAQDILNLKWSSHLVHTTLLQWRTTMSMTVMLTVLEPATWIKLMVPPTQQLASTPTLWSAPTHGFPCTTMEMKVLLLFAVLHRSGIFGSLKVFESYFSPHFIFKFHFNS